MTAPSFSRNRWFLATLVVGLFVCSVPGVGASAPILFETTNTTFGRAFGYAYPFDGQIHDVAERYKPTVSQQVCRVSSLISLFSVSNTSVPVPSVTLKVLRGGTAPNQGVLLQSVTLDRSRIGDSLRYTDFDLNSCITLDAGVNYWFTFSLSQYNVASYVAMYSNFDQGPSSSLWSQTAFQSNYGVWSEVTNQELSLKLEGALAPTATSLAQFAGDVTTAVAESASLEQGEVVLSAKITSPIGKKVKLEVAVGQSLGTTATAVSALVDSGTVVTVSLTNLADGDYFWQARTLDVDGNASAWIPFGAPAITDFKIRRIPVIIIPGILGSELSNGSDLIWPDLGQMFGDIGDEFMSAALGLDSSGDSINQVTVGSAVETMLDGVRFAEVNIFQDLHQQLENDQYVDNANLSFFPYDWRLDLDETKDLLKQKIDAVKAQTGASKVNLVAHSMGGLLVKDYLSQYGKSSVDKLIFVGTSHLGAPKAAKALTVGDRFNVPVLAESAMKGLALNAPAVYELLPNQKYFDQFTDYLKVFKNVGGFNVIESLDYANSKDFILSKGANADIFDKAEAFFGKNLQDLNFSGIDTYNIAGCKTGTQAVYQYGAGNSEIVKMGYTSGDETVPLASADYINISDDHKYYYKNGQHAELPSDESVRNLISNILKGKTVTLPGDLAQGDDSLCDFKGKELLWRSPVEIHVYDQFGNHTGPIENNAIEYGVPGVDYEIIGHRKFVFLPTDNGQVYTVVTKGEEVGTFDMLVSDNDNGVITKTTVFNDVAITSDSVANLEVSNQSQDDTMSFDKEGDGQFEELAADTVLPAGQGADTTPPETNGVVDGTKGSGDSYTGDVSVTLNAADDLSGVLETKYSLDNGATFTTYTSPITFTADGAYSIQYYSVDKAGNSEVVKTVSFTIERPVEVPADVPVEPVGPNSGVPVGDPGTISDEPVGSEDPIREDAEPSADEDAPPADNEIVQPPVDTPPAEEEEVTPPEEDVQPEDEVAGSPTDSPIEPGDPIEEDVVSPEVEQPPVVEPGPENDQSVEEPADIAASSSGGGSGHRRSSSGSTGGQVLGATVTEEELNISLMEQFIALLQQVLVLLKGRGA